MQCLPPAWGSADGHARLPRTPRRPAPAGRARRARQGCLARRRRRRSRGRRPWLEGARRRGREVRRGQGLGLRGRGRSAAGPAAACRRARAGDRRRRLRHPPVRQLRPRGRRRCRSGGPARRRPQLGPHRYRATRRRAGGEAAGASGFHLRRCGLDEHAAARALPRGLVRRDADGWRRAGDRRRVAVLRRALGVGEARRPGRGGVGRPLDRRRRCDRRRGPWARRARELHPRGGAREGARRRSRRDSRGRRRGLVPVFGPDRANGQDRLAEALRCTRHLRRTPSVSFRIGRSALCHLSASRWLRPALSPGFQLRAGRHVDLHRIGIHLRRAFNEAAHVICSRERHCARAASHQRACYRMRRRAHLL